MADLAQLERALRNADAAGDVDAARTIAQAIQQTRTTAKPALPFGMQTVANIGGGLVRGAGSIGATLLTPYDLIAGNTKSIGNPERRAGIGGGLQALGVETDSMAYGSGKLAGEIAGTAGVGGALANGLRLIPGAARMAPALDAVRTAGFSAGGLTGAAGLGTRAAGGAITGGAAAGMVNPEDAGFGAGVGAAMPGALQVAGKAGAALGRTFRGPEQTPEISAAIKAARDAGYVIPPTQARPSLGNRLIEGLSGKISTAQNASARNQGVTNKLAAESLGLPGDTKLTPDLLKTVRDTAGQKYQAVGATGPVTPPPAYEQALDAIAAPFKKAAQGFPNAKPSPVIDLVESLKSPQFDAAAAVEKVKELRTAADDAYRTGNTDIGRASKAAAKAIEDALETHLQGLGSPALLDEFRAARQLIAKTYTVEKSLNPTSGSVDARKLASQLNKGKPLSAELKQAASFANQFPKAAQAVEGMGSLPQLSPLDWAAAGSMSAATASPLGMLGLLARPAARGAALSPVVQRRLLQQPPGSMRGLLDSGEFTRLGLLSAPILATDQ
jgi:hypothetical protein